MTEWELRQDVLEYYRRGGESVRLRGERPQGLLEFLRTQDVLRRLMPGTGRSVLDVGGAEGVHAEWLAADGHRVRLVDPVAEHVAAASRLDGVDAELGDARSLRFADGSFDVVLMLGPLYHLTSESERLMALREARRVVVDGGLVVVATISRFAGWHDVTARGAWDAEPWIEDVVDRELVTGAHSPTEPRLFTTAYFHRPEQIAAEFESAGFDRVDQYMVEGAAWLLPNLGPILDSAPDRDRLLSGLRRMESEPSLLGASSHLLTAATG